MDRDKKTTILDYIVRNAKFVFPVIVIAVVAITVSIALKARNGGSNDGGEGSSNPGEESGASISESGTSQDDVQTMQEIPEEVPLVPNEEESIHSIITAYYDAMLIGDRAALTGLYDSISENDLLRYEENARYLDSLTVIDVYTKAGLSEDSTLVYVYYKVCFLNHEEAIPAWQTFYVCKNDQGVSYIKNQNNFTEEECDYIIKVSKQADVVEFSNRITVEYNELMGAHNELLKYMDEFSREVNVAIGVALAEQNHDEEEPSQADGEEAPEEGSGQGESNVAAGPRYGRATTTVNVRNSDSQQAERLGTIVEGTRVEVQEMLVNGWSRIIYEGKDGYVKSEFLQMEESAEGQRVIGTVTATTTINIRAEAGEDADRLGVLAEGESLDLLAAENGWCKVVYNGAVAYVKAEYVTQQ